MSVQALSYILNGHPAKGSERLVMLSLANHAGDDYECWPSIALIAHEANISDQHAKRCIRSLTERGWITRMVNAAPDDRIPIDRRPNLYRIVRGVSDVPPVVDRGVHPRATGGYGLYPQTITRTVM